jgi:uncharacterized protein (DUF983 family)
MAVERCPQCGSLYEFLLMKFMPRDKGHRDCNVCGYRLAVWDSTSIPTYRLIKRAYWPRLRKQN